MGGSLTHTSVDGRDTTGVPEAGGAAEPEANGVADPEANGVADPAPEPQEPPLPERPHKRQHSENDVQDIPKKSMPRSKKKSKRQPEATEEDEAPLLQPEVQPVPQWAGVLPHCFR